jgi:hypothetical protein
MSEMDWQIPSECIEGRIPDLSIDRISSVPVFDIMEKKHRLDLLF